MERKDKVQNKRRNSVNSVNNNRHFNLKKKSPSFREGLISHEMIRCQCCGDGKPDDGEDICENCFQELMNAPDDDMVQVTHEMAIDGGCPEMEGSWIKW